MQKSKYVTTESPCSCTKNNKYWSVPKKDIRMSLEEYSSKYNIKPIKKTDVTDIPNDTPKPIKEIDIQAIDAGNLVGKWMIFVSPTDVDELWNSICKLISENKIWLAKASTNWSRNKQNYTDHVILVYTPNYLDYNDVKRVRKLLRDECSIDTDIPYKIDYYTKLGIYEDTLNKWNLDSEARYIL